MNLAETSIKPTLPGLLAFIALDAWTEQTVEESASTDDMPASAIWAQALQQISESHDRQAFEQLFAHFAPRVKAYMMRLGSDGGRAEELAQEALAAVWRKADQYDPAKAGASTWIFTIARNLRIDAFRKENRPEFDPDDPALVPEPERSAEETVFASQRAEHLKVALRALPEEQRHVVHLSFYEDRTHTEIAKQLDIPLGTVKSRLRLAFQRISNSLGEDL
jgi:RNA polymerase sigma-70 factor (ECF subfamily)